MRRIVIIAIVAILACGLGSCTHRLTDFTVISTKNIPLGEGVHTDFQKGTRRVKGVDVAHTVLFIPLGMPNMKEAIDKAIEQIPGAIGLVDGVVKSSGWTALVYGQNKYIVEGTPLFPSDFDYEEANSGRPNTNRNNSTGSYSQDTPQAQPTNTPTEPTETFIFFHEVKNGETLVSIAQQYEVSVADLIKWNKLNSSSVVRGQKIKILIHD